MKIIKIFVVVVLWFNVTSCEKEKLGGPLDSELSFKEDINPLIEQTCSACHDASAAFPLIPEAAYNTIISNSWVDIQNPTASTIYNAHNTTEKFKEYVLLWIEQGAKNN